MKTVWTLTLILGVSPFFPAQARCQDNPTIQGRELDDRHKKAETLIMIRRAGLARDSSRVDRLLQIVREDNVSEHVITACWALGRIGDPRALAIYNNINFWERGTPVRKLMAIDKARLLYEQAAQGEKSTSSEEAQTRLDIFLHALDLTLPQLKKRYAKAIEQAGGSANSGRMGHYDLFFGRELADIVFAYGDTHLKKLLADAGINFSDDALATWKIKAAAMSVQERIDDLLQKAKADEYTAPEDFNQMLLDMGEPAEQAVAQLLKDISQHRSEYNPNIVRELINLYSYFPQRRDAVVVRPFKNDKDRDVASAANYAEEVITQNKILFVYMDTRY